MISLSFEHLPPSEVGNLIYFALITERIPMIPKFLSDHIDPSAPPFVFGEVFDVPRLSRAVGIHLLQWHKVKDPESQVLDNLGCWTILETVQQHIEIPEPRRNVSWTGTPAWVELTSPSMHHNHASFWSLAPLGFPETGSKSLELPLTNRPSPQHRVSLPPDDHVLYFDFLYYISAHHTWEWDTDYSPAWRFVGQHILPMRMPRRAMNEPTPPFSQQCEEFPVDQCFAPLSVIARRVSEVQEELCARKGIDAMHVIMTSDERDPEWWSDVGALGHPAFIDAIIQSNGAGFVGTSGSTMSTLANRRVQSRNDGATQSIRWGWPGADDH
ncbi:hypothetical protein EV424DRAFT_1469968 [Suillus variegatus]|nr:hypothetical protein EV424DRAFT_1469968 [Suillus variegatus]